MSLKNFNLTEVRLLYNCISFLIYRFLGLISTICVFGAIFGLLIADFYLFALNHLF